MPWPVPPTNQQTTMNGKTVQNGAMNFARPWTAAASSVAVATACSGIRAESCSSAAIIPIAQTLRTMPIRGFPYAELRDVGEVARDRRRHEHERHGAGAERIASTRSLRQQVQIRRARAV